MHSRGSEHVYCYSFDYSSWNVSYCSLFPRRIACLGGMKLSLHVSDAPQSSYLISRTVALSFLSAVISIL